MFRKLSYHCFKYSWFNMSGGVFNLEIKIDGQILFYEIQGQKKRRKYQFRVVL